MAKKAVCGEFFTYFKIITTANAIIFNYSPSGTGGTWAASELSLPPTIYNGIAINLLSGGTITSVRIDPATNMAGFDSSHLSFTANQIQVDWQNLPFDKHTRVKLDIKTSHDGPIYLSPPMPIASKPRPQADIPAQHENADEDGSRMNPPRL